MASIQAQWADGPFELIPASTTGYKPGQRVKTSQQLAQEMIILHNIIIRGINSIYLQCVNVGRSPESVPDFVEYARLWQHPVHEHHDNEETIVFPRIEDLVGAPGLMTPNVEQHAAFHGGLDAFSTYIESVKNGSAKYDGGKIREIIDSFMPVLREHLYDEIQTLLALDRYEDKCDWAAWLRKVHAEIVAQMQADPSTKHTLMPMFMHLHDGTFDNDSLPVWPVLPWIAKVVISWIYDRKHKSWWRFAPCDISSRPQVLPFVD
ncbi:hypothetical protein M406DRAFT_41495 [Cryphonectria parasitica EP155]|uniref:Hemerythrin-like domain-containing protein n=1 Tax=Cryphonectria parasitica (strain ATCC 38755 / EP155) TaxID=660469 RepID=A0A9P4Y698_CRYP1|nr:uncharacterized protein M406DRAFT_41495 [Cryphonectria parasitica EP155]KAF3767739.1 hypothetical protein M406DRAFT_41495 [Cryphonectria parasitica EP155]